MIKQKTLKFTWLVLAVGFCLLLAGRVEAATIVSGDVMDITNGTPGTALEGIEIWCYTVDFAKWEVTTTDTSGAFSIDENDFLAADEARETTEALTAGEWVNLEARVPAGYNGVLNQIGFTWGGNSYEGNPINFQFLNAPKIVTGTVTHSDSGAPISGVFVVAFPIGIGGVGSAGDHTDGSGVYTIYLRTGVSAWSVQAVADMGEYNTNWLPTGKPLNVSFSNNDDVETTTLDFTVETTNASVTVKFLDADGNILRDQLDGFRADCSFFRSDGIGTIRKVDNNGDITNIGLLAGIYSYWCYHNYLTGQSFRDNTFVLTPGQALDLGTIQAEVDSSTISGTITYAQNGQPAFNQQITLSNRNTPQFLTTNTDANGLYTFTVGAGTWVVGMNQGPNPQYRMTTPIIVAIETNGDTSSGNDFQFEQLNLQIGGTITDQSLNTLTGFVGSAFARAESGEYFNAPVNNGQYTIKLPSTVLNQTVSVGVAGDVGSGYGLPTPVDVAVTGNMTQNLALVADDATVTGTVQDSGGNALTLDTNEIAVVAVDDNGNLERVYAGTLGSYTITVPHGNWNVSFRVEKTDSTYVAPASQSNPATLAASGTATVNLTAKTRNAIIVGTITAPDGTGVPMAPVIVTNIPILEALDSFDPEDMVQLSTSTNFDGTYSITVPAGDYTVFCGTTPDVGATVVKPEAALVTAVAGTPATANLAFTASDATLTGTVTDADGNAVTSGTIGAYTDNGGFVSTDIASDGSYTLSVDSGDTWQLVATSLDGQDLLMSEQTGVETSAGANAQDITVEDSNINVPGSVTQSFDADAVATVTLPNGGSVQFSPFAIDSTGTVEVSIDPTIELTPTLSGTPVSISYDISARNNSDVQVASLNSPAKITMPFDEGVLAANGVNEDNLMPQYYSETEEFWGNSGLATIVNTSEDMAVAYSDHLTTFNINGAVTEDIASELVALAITTVSPASVYNNHPNTITVTGTGFTTSGTTLKLVRTDNTQITDLTLTVASTTQASFSLPGEYNADTYDVVLTRASDSKTATKTDALVVKTAENVLVVTPAAGGGPQVRLMKADGSFKKQFYAYAQTVRGGYFTAMCDINADGTQEVVVAPGRGLAPEVKVFNQAGTKLYSFYAYDQNFRGGVSVACGDADNDGKDEIVTLPFSSGGSNCRIFGLRHDAIIATTENFFIFPQALRGGFSLALPDFEGDGPHEIAVAPVSKGSAHVQIFGYRSNIQKYKAVILGVKVYGESFHGGVTLAAGDIDGDGDDELISGTYSNGGPHVVTLYRKPQDQKVHKLNPGWFAFDRNFHGGVNVATVDSDNDGNREIVAAVRSSSAPLVRTFKTDGSQILEHFYAFAQTFLGGVNVSSGVYLP